MVSEALGPPGPDLDCLLCPLPAGSVRFIQLFSWSAKLQDQKCVPGFGPFLGTGQLVVSACVFSFPFSLCFKI